MTEPTNEQARVLTARLRERCDNLGGCESYGADHEDVERAMPFIISEAAMQERERLIGRAERLRKSMTDTEYGAVMTVLMFADVTETDVERGRELAKEHPEWFADSEPDHG